MRKISLFKDFLKRINSVLEKKIIFFKIKQYDVLILDDGFANLDFKNVCSFKIITNEVYLNCFLKAVFKTLFSKNKKNIYLLSDFYLQELVKKINPKIIIGHDFKSKIFKIKKSFPEIFTIIYQFSDHDISNKAVLNQAIGSNLNLDEFKCDIYLSKHKIFNPLVDFIKAKFLVVGSVRNNEIILKNLDKKIYDIMMISQYRERIPSFFGTYNLKLMHVVYSAMAYVTRIISAYCDKKNKKLCIAKTSSRNDKKNSVNKINEIEFFSKFSKNFYEEDIDSYNLAGKSKLIVSTYSTLGLELLSRGKKVLFIDPFHFLGGDQINMFTEDLEGPHWYCGHDVAIIEKKIDYLLNISDEEWKKVMMNSPFKIKYDAGNKILKELVKNKVNAQKI